MKYQPPYGVEDPDAGYVNGDPSIGRAGSIPPAQAIEYPQREVVNCITKGGVVPDDGDLFQLTRGVRRALFAFGIDTGSVNSLSIALDPPLLSYQQGLEVRILIANNNTAATTIRINGLSTQQILKKDGSSLLGGDLRVGGIAVLVYDGANFQLVSGAAGSTTITGGWFNGADYIVDNGTPNHIAGAPPIAPTAYAAGQSYLVLVKNRNTGPVDINVNALGVRAITLPTGQPLNTSDLVPNMLLRIGYDGSQFVMLSPIDTAVIGQPMTKIVGPNAGADFPNLNAAADWFSRRTFDGDGTLTIQLQGQTTGSPVIHNYAENINLNLPQGNKIIIQGTGMNFIPVGADFPTNVGPGSPGGIVTEANTNVTKLRTAFQSEIRFAAGFGLDIQGGAILLKNVLFTGSGMSGNTAYKLLYVHRTSVVQFETIAACLSPGYCLYMDDGSTMYGKNLYAIGANYCIYVDGSSLTIGTGAGPGGPTNDDICIIADALQNGLTAILNSDVQLACLNTWARIYSCQKNGLHCWGASSVNATYTWCQNCWQYAMIAHQSIMYVGQGFLNACGYGYTASSAEVDCSTCSTSGILYGDYIATHGSYMYAAGFGNGSAQFSPARNTYGNGNSYIEA